MEAATSVFTERHLSLKEAQAELGVSERTIHRWIKSGKLKSYKPGRDHRIPESAIRQVMEESEVYPLVEPRLPLETGGVSVGLDAIEGIAGAWEEELPHAVDARIHGIYQDASRFIHQLMPNGWNPPIEEGVDNIALASERLQAMEPGDKEHLWRTYVALLKVQAAAERMIWPRDE